MGMKSFTSTTTDIDTIQDFMRGDMHSVVMRIKSTNGVYIDDISGMPGEFEVLFKPDTKFIIGKISKVTDKRYRIELEELV